MSEISTFVRRRWPELVLGAILVAYFITPFTVPPPVYQVFRSPLGALFVLLIMMYLFIYSNPLIACLFVVVCIDLFCRSAAMAARTPDPSTDDSAGPVNMFPYTLEEEVVDTLAPHTASAESVPYQPVEADTRCAAPASNHI